MLKQIQKLTALQLCNLFGINEVRYTKDKKKKDNFILLTLAWILVGAMILAYIALLSFGMIEVGMSEILPMYLYMITSLIILIFSFFKAGGVIFQMKNFEILLSLPISKTAVVISRFLSMYTTNMFMSLLIMLPGTIIYGIYNHPGPLFYIFIFIGTLFLPLLPITLSTAVGVLIAGIGSRMKHKNLVIAALTIIFAIVVMAGSMLLSGNSDTITPDMIRDITDFMTAQIKRIYPPAVWFGTAAVQTDFISFIMLIGSALVLFICMVALVQKYFLTICTALNATHAKNNYKMQSLSTRSVLKALRNREIKRYFASSIYVSNTIVGYILMLLVPVAILFTGPEKFETLIGYPGIVVHALPVLLGMIAAMVPMTACSISIEGKNWWLMQSLPIKTKTIIDSKILTHLTIVLPFYVVSVILSWIAVKPTLINGIWLILIPAVYIIFSSIAGIAANIQYPVFNWDNETRVVKQSGSIMLMLLVDFIIGIPPIFLLLMAKTIPSNLIMAATALILTVMTIRLYLSNIRKSVLDIQ